MYLLIYLLTITRCFLYFIRGSAILRRKQPASNHHITCKHKRHWRGYCIAITRASSWQPVKRCNSSSTLATLHYTQVVIAVDQ